MNHKSDKGLYLYKDFVIANNHEPGKKKGILKTEFHKTLAAFIDTNTFKLRPDEMIFIEDDSTLIDQNNKPINSF